MSSSDSKAIAHVSKKRWADMCAVLIARFGDCDQTQAAIMDLQSVLHYDPQGTTSSEAQRERVRKLRQRQKVILAAAAACPDCCTHAHPKTRASESGAT